jgi:hypothetical protein
VKVIARFLYLFSPINLRSGELDVLLSPASKYHGNSCQIIPNTGSALLFIVLLSVIHDVEEAKLVYTLRCRDNTKPVTKLLLLEEFLGPAVVLWLAPYYLREHVSRRDGHVQVLQVATREFLMGNNLNLSITLLADLNSVAEVTSAAVDLDAVVEEFLEGGEIEDFVVDGLGGIDHKLFD